ncbi:hypothetical protein PR202_gb05646 [Eleusine coracana subsp. coracana]|uniref:Uncharacterized protein n=1 Tax=Eleusine coracana subsp. coracana TaxID=191504 RepID=A0AAV5E7J9_ELECO|nr:hypothetical protein PR202_gb05646 [Eleusine coracana subsp. coracana]
MTMPPAMCLPKVGADEKIEATSAASCRICFESSCERGRNCFFPLHNMQGTVPSPRGISREQHVSQNEVPDVIASIGAMAYLLDKDGKFRNSFSGDWDGFLSKHPVPFYYSVGVVVFSALVGVCGIILDCSLCSSLNTNYPYVAGSSNCAIDSAEGCIVVIVVFVIIFAVLGLFFGFVAATVGAQRILQRHCGILMKKELTKAS